MIRWVVALFSIISLGTIAKAQELPSKSELLEVFGSRPCQLASGARKRIRDRGCAMLRSPRPAKSSPLPMGSVHTCFGLA